MRADTRERAEAVAAFLASAKRHPSGAPVVGALPVGQIAQLDGCPVRPPREAEWLAEWPDANYRWVEAAVGQEPHCHRVTAALEAAVKLGLVEKTRTGKGPWLYRATTGGER